jgi:hypothetical protein
MPQKHAPWLVAVFLALGLITDNSPASAQVPSYSSHPQTASDSLPFRADRESTSNFGVEVSSFVVPTGDIPVINGVDVSKYQDAVDFEMLRRVAASLPMFGFPRAPIRTTSSDTAIYGNNLVEPKMSIHRIVERRAGATGQR